MVLAVRAVVWSSQLIIQQLSEHCAGHTEIQSKLLEVGLDSKSHNAIIVSSAEQIEVDLKMDSSEYVPSHKTVWQSRWRGGAPSGRPLYRHTCHQRG